MRRHAADTVITATLRHLDPASRTDLTKAELERADAAFARIVATPSDDPVTVEPDRPHRRRSRLLVAAGLAGAVGAAIPGLLLLGGGTAYGSWTPTPEPLTDVAAARAAATCRAARCASWSLRAPPTCSVTHLVAPSASVAIWCARSAQAAVSAST